MKKLLTFMIVWTCLLTLAGCGKKDMDYTMQNESSVAESVRETGEESVLIQNEDAGEGENAAPETKVMMIPAMGTITFSDSPRIIWYTPPFQPDGVCPTSAAIVPTFSLTSVNILVRLLSIHPISISLRACSIFSKMLPNISPPFG